MGYDVTVSIPRLNGTLFGIQPNMADDCDCTYYFWLGTITPLYCQDIKSQSRKELLSENLGRVMSTPSVTT